MEVKLDTNLPGYGGQIIQHLDAMIGQRFLENPYSYCHDRLFYAMSPAERQWVGQSPRTLGLVHPETGYLFVSVNQLRVQERLAVRDAGLGSHGGASGFNGRQIDLHETKSRIKEIMEAYASTYRHFMEAPRHASPEFPSLASEPASMDIDVPRFYTALRQRIGFMKATELETALYRFHAVAVLHEKESLSETIQFQRHLRQVTTGTALGRDGQLTSYGDTLFELHQSLGQVVEYQRKIEQSPWKGQPSRSSLAGRLPDGRGFFDR